MSAIFAKYAEKRYRIFRILLPSATPVLEMPEFLRPIRAVDLRTATAGAIRQLAFEIAGQEPPSRYHKFTLAERAEPSHAAGASTRDD